MSNSLKCLLINVNLPIIVRQHTHYLSFNHAEILTLACKLFQTCKKCLMKKIVMLNLLEWHVID